MRAIGDRVGDASALKMCYAALNKGTIALMTGVSVMAERLGVSGAFGDELALSQEAALRRMRQQVPGMVPKAHRWIGEMEEIAKTFEQARARTRRVRRHRRHLPAGRGKTHRVHLAGRLAQGQSRLRQAWSEATVGEMTVVGRQ